MVHIYSSLSIRNVSLIDGLFVSLSVFFCRQNILANTRPTNEHLALVELTDCRTSPDRTNQRVKINLTLKKCQATMITNIACLFSDFGKYTLCVGELFDTIEILVLKKLRRLLKQKLERENLFLSKSSLLLVTVHVSVFLPASPPRPAGPAAPSYVSAM